MNTRILAISSALTVSLSSKIYSHTTEVVYDVALVEYRLVHYR